MTHYCQKIYDLTMPVSSTPSSRSIGIERWRANLKHRVMAYVSRAGHFVSGRSPRRRRSAGFTRRALGGRRMTRGCIRQIDQRDQSNSTSLSDTHRMPSSVMICNRSAFPAAALACKGTGRVDLGTRCPSCPASLLNSVTVALRKPTMVQFLQGAPGETPATRAGARLACPAAAFVWGPATALL
jgi:hypothetical protein